MTRPEPMRLGPFAGGMNTYSDPSGIQDNELVDCVNLELDTDGSLVCRPAIRNLTGGHSASPWTTRLKVIGQGVWDNTQVLFGTSALGAASKPTLWYLSSPTSAWTLIANAPNGKEMRAVVQCGGMAVFIPAAAGQGGYWNPTDGWISDPNIPAGNAASYWKGRVWVVPGPNPAVAYTTDTVVAESRVRFTDPLIGKLSATNMLVWDGPVEQGVHKNTNFFDVSNGDGQDLVDCTVYLDQLVLFKTDSTHVFAFESTMDTALLRCINTEIGATSRVCVAVYEDIIFTFHQGRVYEINNYQFTQINEKVPFVLDEFAPPGFTRENTCFVCVVEDRLIVRYFNRVYIYGLLTKTWSRLEAGKDTLGVTNQTLQNVGYLRLFPSDNLRNIPKHYIGGSVLREETMVFEWIETPAVDVFETVDGATRLTIDCSVTTKTIDVDDPFNFKKLSWWGLDVISGKNVTAIVRPIQLHWASTWDNISNQSWDSLLTWDHLTDTPYFIEDIVIDASVPMRKFYKVQKALRFRLISFNVIMHSDASTKDGPARLFTIVPWIGRKETVVKRVS